MRVSGGKYKNKKILTALKHSEATYRPSSERTRQSIFNLLLNSDKFSNHQPKGAVVADVYCGSGSFGIEALSRDAEFVFFVDQSPEQLKLTQKNLSLIHEEDHSKMVRCDATNLPPATKAANIVFIDPPYKCNLVNPTIKSLVNQKWIANHGLIIIEHSEHEVINFTDSIKLLDERVYGKTKLTFCVYEE
jgi:16S rRNA (guanine966-N2)-methyltransferase